MYLLYRPSRWILGIISSAYIGNFQVLTFKNLAGPPKLQDILEHYISHLFFFISKVTIKRYDNFRLLLSVVILSTPYTLAKKCALEYYELRNNSFRKTKIFIKKKKKINTL